ncbi:pterocarpan synthase 1-like [Miscanthus floridulus]|uniref:pterocarpan synthase 1-like n=1 Tax=Miscanthus floridulus TaxID=154761 RepID=UPI0034580B88
MATPLTLLFLFLCPAIVLAIASPAEKTGLDPCVCPQENQIRMHMYLHQFPAWPNVSNPNEVGAIGSSQPIGFGTMYVHDWFLTIGPNPNETIVARVQGFHLQAGQTATSWYTSQIIVFQDDNSFAGSTLEVLGITLPPRPSGGQWSIMDGTGTFTNAHGNIKYNDVQSTESSITDVVKELNIHIFYTPEIST